MCPHMGQKKWLAVQKNCMVREMQLIRNMADYEGEAVTRKDASQQIRKAEEMLRLIKKGIGK